MSESRDSEPGRPPRRAAILIGVESAEVEALKRQVGELVNVVAIERHATAGLAQVRERTPVVSLMFLDHEPEPLLGIIREVARFGGTPPLVLSRNREPDQVLKALRQGASDVTNIDSDEDVRRALLKILSANPESKTLGKLVAVFSAKGGSGATAIATNLAGCLVDRESGSEKAVVILDLDFQMGDVLAFLDVACRYSWKDLTSNIHRLDRELLLQSLTEHSGGLRVVSQTDHPEEADDVDAKGIAEGIALLRRNFDFVVVDGLRDFRETSLVVLDAADIVIMTFTQDVPALKNANRCLTVMKRLGYDRDTIKLVLNRYTKDKGVDREAIADALGFDIAAVVSNDFPTVVGAINEGKLLTEAAPRARVTRDVASLVTLVHGTAPEPERRGLFARWRKA